MTTEHPQLTFHWLSRSRSFRAMWLLEELGLSYNTVPYVRVNGMRSPESMKAISPLGKAPMLEVDSAGDKRVLVESGHITNYLIKHFDTLKKFTPDNSNMEDDVDYYVQMAEGSLMPPVNVGLVLGAVQSLAPWPIGSIVGLLKGQLIQQYVVPEASAILNVMENKLQQSKETSTNGEIYLVGRKLSAADIMVEWNTQFIFSHPEFSQYFSKTKYPLIHGWLEQLKKRPAYQKAVEIEHQLEIDNHVV